jgi:hypothetical protein
MTNLHVNFLDIFAPIRYAMFGYQVMRRRFFIPAGLSHVKDRCLNPGQVEGLAKSYILLQENKRAKK